MSDKEQAKARMLLVMPYLRRAIAKASEKGTVKLGVLCVQPDGSGAVEMQFDGVEFFADLSIVLDAPAQTTKDNAVADGLAFRQKHGLTVTPQP